MNVLRVYAKKNGEGPERLIFAQLIDSPAARATAAKNAALHHYVITRIMQAGTAATGWAEVYRGDSLI